MENRVTDKEEETPMDAISKKSKSLKKSSNTGNPLMQILNGEFLSKEFVVKNLGFTGLGQTDATFKPRLRAGQFRPPLE